MYYFRSSIVIISFLFTSTALAAALPRRASSSSLVHSKIQRVASNSRTPRSGTLAVHKAYKKYGWDIPQRLSDAAAEYSRVAISKEAEISANTNTGISGDTSTSTGSGDGSASVNSTPVKYNAEYLCPVSIGGQILNLDLDTGSSDLWLLNPSLGSDATSGHNIYNNSASKSFKVAEDTVFYLEYGDKSKTSGPVGTDTVAVGDITVISMDVELPNTVNSNIRSDKSSDGILGLGFQSLNGICKKSTSASAAGSSNGCPAGYKPQPRQTWFENAKSSLKAGLFTANLKKGTAGSFEFGTIDQTAFKAPLTYTPIDNSRGYWGFRSETMQVSGGTSLSRTDANFAIVDSGTSALLLDPEVVTAYYASVPTAQHDGGDSFIFPCGTTLPELKVAIGNYTATIPGDLLNFAPSSTGSNMCFGGLQSNSGSGLQVFGDILFQAEFLVFDYDHLQLGLAPHA